MQNVIGMLTAALVNFPDLVKLMALNIGCFVVSMLFVAFGALFSAIFVDKARFIDI